MDKTGTVTGGGPEVVDMAWGPDAIREQALADVTGQVTDAAQSLPDQARDQLS